MRSPRSPSGFRHQPRAGQRPRRLWPQRRSASGHCWPGGWSRPACRSSRSTTAAGTITPSSSTRCKKRLPTFDQTVAALIEDLDQRGLLDTTTGDRPGRVRPDAADQQGVAGRDHWSNAMSVLFAGGGTPGGQVVGATDRQGYARRGARAVARRTSPRRSTPSSASIPARSSTLPTAGRPTWSATRRRSKN